MIKNKHLFGKNGWVTGTDKLSRLILTVVASSFGSFGRYDPFVPLTQKGKKKKNTATAQRIHSGPSRITSLAPVCKVMKGWFIHGVSYLLPRVDAVADPCTSGLGTALTQGAIIHLDREKYVNQTQLLHLPWMAERLQNISHLKKKTKHKTAPLHTPDLYSFTGALSRRVWWCLSYVRTKLWLHRCFLCISR